MALSVEIQKSFKSLRLHLGVPDGMLSKTYGDRNGMSFSRKTPLAPCLIGLRRL